MEESGWRKIEPAGPCAICGPEGGLSTAWNGRSCGVMGGMQGTATAFAVSVWGTEKSFWHWGSEDQGAGIGGTSYIAKDGGTL
jgi:hypothetical protein